MLQAQRRLADVTTRLAHRERAPLLEEAGQVGALEVLHDEEVRAAGSTAIEDGDHVGVRQFRRQPRLALEALDGGGHFQGLGADDLQGDNAVHAGLPCPVDGTHPALAKQVQHDVAAEDQFMTLAAGKLVGLEHGEPAAADQLLG
jgi:hypothetical protein